MKLEGLKIDVQIFEMPPVRGSGVGGRAAITQRDVEEEGEGSDPRPSTSKKR